MAKREIENRCGKCNSTQTYIRVKDNSRICRGCGNIQELKK